MLLFSARSATSLVLSSCALLFAVAACSSSSPEGSGSSSGGSSGTAQNDGGPKPEEEGPLQPRAVCNTVAADSTTGQGCSGSGTGQELCPVASTTCGTGSCVYDTRLDNTFRFYCAPTCTVGGDQVCPLGFACAAPTASCAQGTAGLCARDAAWTCNAAIDTTGLRYFEGPTGDLFALKSLSGKATLSVLADKALRELTSWDEASASVIAVLPVGAARGLLITGEKEISFDTASATVAARQGARSYNQIFGTLADGSIAALETTGTIGFAALHKRGESGQWTEVGPTKKRIGRVLALRSGFLANTDGELSVSSDGETFTAIAAPPGATLKDAAFVAAGRSTEDFYLALAGHLHRFRKGSWVEEGPRGGAAVAGRSDLLRVSTKNVVAFHTWNGQSYSSFIANGTGCWRTNQVRDFELGTLAGESFFLSPGVSSRDKGLCQMPAK